MKKLLGVAAIGALLGGTLLAAVEYKPVADWLKLPEGRPQMGNQHGDVAVSAKGEVYVSVQDPQAGLQVYAPDGKFLRNVPNAPSDFHGFVIRRQPDGEFIFGTRLREQTIVKMTLDGQVVLTIPAAAIPDEFKVRNARSNQLALSLTGMDVAPNGDLYVTDGYASDYIHRFDRTGKYLKSFGGKKEPYNFSTLHKLAIDTRFQPVRLIACDRANNRVVHLSLDGDFLGRGRERTCGCRRPWSSPATTPSSGSSRARSACSTKRGRWSARFGTNTGEGVGTNQLKPELWQTGLVVSPHGVAINERGDLFVSEFNMFGRVHRFNRQ